jgi:hypothetical protein
MRVRVGVMGEGGVGVIIEKTLYSRGWGGGII